MDKIFEDFLEKLISECLLGARFSYLAEKEKKETTEKLRDHFYDVIIDTLINQLSEEQLKEIRGLDSASPKMQEKLSLFAASLPGVGFFLEEKLKKELDRILETGQIES